MKTLVHFDEFNAKFKLGIGILNFLASDENYYICEYILTNIKHMQNMQING